MQFFETLERQPCKQRSDLVLNGQINEYYSCDVDIVYFMEWSRHD